MQVAFQSEVFSGIGIFLKLIQLSLMLEQGLRK